MKRHTISGTLAAVAAVTLPALGTAQPLEAAPTPAPLTAPPVAAEPTRLDTVVLAGGCFWGVEAVFEHVKGVQSVVSGYAGGSARTASYYSVASGRTDHAESVRVIFDPEQVSVDQLLRVFFDVAHDPTQLNRQGPDVGPQYRSAIWYGDEAQRRVAQNYIAQLEEKDVLPRPIVTEVEPLDQFYLAEDYHQDFLVENPRHPYIVAHDLPKLEDLRRSYPELWREQPSG